MSYQPLITHMNYEKNRVHYRVNNIPCSMDISEKMIVEVFGKEKSIITSNTGEAVQVEVNLMLSELNRAQLAEVVEHFHKDCGVMADAEKFHASSFIVGPDEDGL